MRGAASGALTGSLEPLAKRVASIVQDAGGALFDIRDRTSLYSGVNGGSNPSSGAVFGLALDKSQMAGVSADAYLAGRTNRAVNGGFDTNTDWSGTNWTIAAGKATHTPGSTADLTTSVAPMDVDEWYCIDYVVSGRTAGTITPYAGTTAGSAISADGPRRTFLRAATTGNMIFRPTSTFDGAIDDVVIRHLSIQPAVAPANGQRPIVNASGYADFDGGDDLLNAVIASNMGTNVSVYHRTQAGAHVWLTGQTINAGNYALSTTDWIRAAIIPGGVTPSQQSLIEAWGASS